MSITPESSVPRVAVIGAGIAGTACARKLQRRGLAVTVFDKSHAPGGRVATRHSDRLQFDHGAQYFTARDPRFVREVDRWIEAGVAAEWTPRIVRLTGQAVRPATESRRFVGTPSMSAVPTRLATGLHIRWGVRVVDVSRVNHGWLLVGFGGELLGVFDIVVVALPAPQAVSLLAATPELAQIAESVVMTPSWALMIDLEEPLDPGYDAAFVDHPVVSWIARDGSKPGRPVSTAWVVHATPEWSAGHVEGEAAAVADQLSRTFGGLVGVPDLRPRFKQAHRWRYALPSPVDEPCLWNVAQSIGACGDWCGGPRVEGAFLSGLAMARQVLAATTEEVAT